MRVDCARMMRSDFCVRRKPAFEKLGAALRGSAMQIIQAGSDVLTSMVVPLKLLGRHVRALKVWFLRVLPFEIRWKSYGEREIEHCFGLPVEIQVDSDEELIPDLEGSPAPAEASEPASERPPRPARPPRLLTPPRKTHLNLNLPLKKSRSVPVRKS